VCHMAMIQGAGGGTGGQASSSGDYSLSVEWLMPRFVKCVWVKATDSFYRVNLYRKTRNGWELVDSKAMNSETKLAFFYYPMGVYMPNGLKATIKDALANDVFTLKFEAAEERKRFG